jgi:hypothetical protein
MLVGGDVDAKGGATKEERRQAGAAASGCR